MMYYGSKYGKDADPEMFWVEGGYFTSSVSVKQLIIEYGAESFEPKVTRVFTTAEEALAHEYRFIERVGAVRSPMWLNENNGGKKFYNVGPDSDETRAKKAAIVRTPESNAKRSAALKCVPKPEGFSEKLSIAQQNRPEEKEMARQNKIRAKAAGRRHKDDTRQKLKEIVSDTRWVKKDGAHQKIQAKELDHYISEGWEQGRIVTITQCPHCGLRGAKYNLVRRHFDKCKSFIKE
jgi:hypothetical protein